MYDGANHFNHAVVNESLRHKARISRSRLGQRRAAEAAGRSAEDEVAARFLARGFTLLARRFRNAAGEVDLILADAQTLIFIEVKSRKSLAEAAYAVTPRQQARLFAAASAALAAQANWQRPNTRFDVALVCGDVVELIEDAIRYH